ncbi:MAG: hypothetical protein LBQ58_11215 [Synergistaceae bacterium]|nr:hypothetical protein [Synergistaceae bacterium]
MRTKRSLISLVIVFFLASCVFFDGKLFAADDSTPLYEVMIPFEEGGVARAYLPDGRGFDLGRVVKLPLRTQWPSYTASAWGKPGAVTASAVNAIHILMGVESGRGRTISVIPAETIAPAAGPGAAVVLDCKGGTSFFGAWAPPVGAPVFVKSGESISPLGNLLPESGDVLIFRVYEDNMPYMVDFENRPGGRVIAWSTSGAMLIARVVRPLGGTGRFDGTLYQGPGRIRANHSGVIDVSTSEYGTIGGFQIIPWDHALHSSEMQGAWQMTQWMIIAHPDGKSMMGGTSPLFARGLVPGTQDGESLWDLWSTYGRKSLVMARIDGGPWQHLPRASGRDDNAMKRITHLRIYFPISKEPLI